MQQSVVLLPVCLSKTGAFVLLLLTGFLKLHNACIINLLLRVMLPAHPLVYLVCESFMCHNKCAVSAPFCICPQCSDALQLDF